MQVLISGFSPLLFGLYWGHIGIICYGPMDILLQCSGGLTYELYLGHILALLSHQKYIIKLSICWIILEHTLNFENKYVITCIIAVIIIHHDKILNRDWSM